MHLKHPGKPDPSKSVHSIIHLVENKQGTSCTIPAAIQEDNDKGAIKTHFPQQIHGSLAI